MADTQNRLDRKCEEAVRRAQASFGLFVTLHPPEAYGLQLQIRRRYTMVRFFRVSVWEGVHAEDQRPEYSAHQRRRSSEE